MKDLIVEKENELLVFLENKLKDISKKKLKSLLKYKCIKVNNKVVTKFDYKLKINDKVTINFNSTKQDNLDILYEDKYKVFSMELKKLVQKNLKDCIQVEENLKSKQNTSSNNTQIILQKDNTRSFTGFMKELSSKNILPKNYDYNKVRRKLAEMELYISTRIIRQSLQIFH